MKHKGNEGEGTKYTIKWSVKGSAITFTNTNLRNREIVRVLIAATERYGPVLILSVEKEI